MEYKLYTVLWETQVPSPAGPQDVSDVPTVCLELQLTLATSTGAPSPTDTGSPSMDSPIPKALPADPVLWGRLVADEGQLCPGGLGGGVGDLEDIL